MASDGKIYITISNQMGGSVTPPPTPTPAPSTQQIVTQEDETGAFDFKKVAIGVAIQAGQITMNALNNYQQNWVNNYGNYTGNYEAQLTKQANFEKLKRVERVAMKTVAGLATGTLIASMTSAGSSAGPIGAVIGFAVGVVSEMVTYTVSQSIETENYIKQTAIMNTKANVLRMRAGYSNLNNGSRGTDD